MQLLQRSNVFKLVMLVVLIYGQYAAAETGTAPPDSDIQQIHAAFNLPDDNKGIMNIGKRVYESDEHPTEVAGYYIREPFMYQNALCVLERYSKLGMKVDGLIQWYEDADTVETRYWLTETPKSCDVTSEEDVPDAVHVNDLVDIESVFIIMSIDRELIQQAIARPDGARFGEWLDARLVGISLPKRLNGKSVDTVIFGAEYSLPGKLEGPIVYFSLLDGRFEIELVGSWIF